MSHGIPKSFLIAHNLEVCANLGACIPFYGNQVITCRLIASIVQTIYGAALLVFSTLGEVFLDDKPSPLSSKTWGCLQEEGSEHFKHGPLNIGAAISQLIIGQLTFNMGNLVLHLYLKGNFDPFIPYEGIKVANAYVKNPFNSNVRSKRFI